MNTLPCFFRRSPLPHFIAIARPRRRSFPLHGLLGAALLGALFALPRPPASADVMVSAFADGPDGLFEVTGSSVDFSGASHLHASATSGGSTSVNTGPLGTSGVNFPHGAGRAEANGATGLLRASGGSIVASGNFGGGGTAVIRDVITFLSPTPEITIHVDGSLVATHPGHAAMDFSVSMPGNGPESGDTLLFGLNAVDSNGRYHTIGGALATDPTDYTPGIPDVFEYTFSIPPAWLQFMGNTFALEFSLTAGAHDENSGHFARANYESTAYIGIKGPYTSAHGYTYDGFAPASRVPDSSSTVALFGAAAVGLCLGARSRSRGAGSSARGLGLERGGRAV